MPYCTRADIEAKYGRTNVAKWADLDNEEDATAITATITAAIEEAEARVNDELRGGRYTIPFVNVPVGIKHATAALAGIFLYRPRAVDDNAEDSSFGTKEKDIIKYLRQIKAGIMSLDAPTQAISYPASILTVLLDPLLAEEG